MHFIPQMTWEVNIQSRGVRWDERKKYTHFTSNILITYLNFKSLWSLASQYLSGESITQDWSPNLPSHIALTFNPKKAGGRHEEKMRKAWLLSAGAQAVHCIILEGPF